MVPNVGSYSGQGFLNAFYEPKEGGLTPKEFSEFNAPTVLLTEFNPGREIFVSGETADVEIRVSHFGGEPIPAGKVVWTLLDRNEGRSLSSGWAEYPEVATGYVGPLAKVTMTIPPVKKPVQAEFRVNIEGATVANHWRTWIFPNAETPRENAPKIAATARILDRVRSVFPDAVLYDPNAQPPLGAGMAVLIGPGDSSALVQALAENRRVLLIGSADGGPNVTLGWWSFSDQLGTGFDAGHEAFGDFPVSEYLDAVWFRVFKTGRDLTASPFEFGRLTPLAVCETTRSYSLYAGFGKIGGAKILATFGLDLLADLPEAKSLLANFAHYTATGDFANGAENPPVPQEAVDRLRVREETLKNGMTGFGQIEKTGGFSYSGGHYFCDGDTIHVLQFLDGKNELCWQTKPVPADLSADRATWTFGWVGGVGFTPEKKNRADIFLDEIKLGEFSFGVTDKGWKKEWMVGDRPVTLEYQPQEITANEAEGFFFLTVPRSMVTPEKASRLRLLGAVVNSSDWFGVVAK